METPSETRKRLNAEYVKAQEEYREALRKMLAAQDAFKTQFALPVGTVIRLNKPRDRGLGKNALTDIGHIVEVKTDHWGAAGFFPIYKIGAVKTNGVPSRRAILAYYVKEDEIAEIIRVPGKVTPRT